MAHLTKNTEEAAAGSLSLRKGLHVAVTQQTVCKQLLQQTFMSTVPEPLLHHMPDCIQRLCKRVIGDAYKGRKKHLGRSKQDDIESLHHGGCKAQVPLLIQDIRQGTEHFLWA